MGPRYPLSQTGIKPKVSNSLLQGSLLGPIMGFHRRGRVGRSGRGEGSTLSPCASPRLMLGCCGFSGGFCWSCGASNDGHDAGGLLPRLARLLMGGIWLGLEHDASISVAGKGFEVISPSMGSEIGLVEATRFPLGPLSSEDIGNPARWPLVWS